MSRLFDALKESVASKAYQGTVGRPTDEVWEALGVDAAVPAPALNDPDIEPRGAEGKLDDDIALVFPDDQEAALNALPNLPLGNPTEVALDPKARLIIHATDPSVAEQYRRLRAKLLQQQEEKLFRSLVVTSAGPQEGKTVTVLNLGLSFAMLASYKVVVVDGDLRRGSLGKWLGVDDQHPGLSNLFDGSAQLDEVILKSESTAMHFVVRGNSQIPDLDSTQLSTHFRRLTELYDLVLVDSPPVNLIADVQLLAGSCDAVLLVARAFSTTRKSFERAVQDLKPFRMIGTVLNCGTSQRSTYRGDYY
jgi:capsular exopolysaccharide synthesis family protein